MYELNAKGREPHLHWSRALTENKVIRLGRYPDNGWDVEWDQRISREHCDLELREGKLMISCLERARNPIFTKGQYTRQCSIEPGQEFIIGHTVFTFVHTARVAESRPSPPAKGSTAPTSREEPSSVGDESGGYANLMNRIRSLSDRVATEQQAATALSDDAIQQIRGLLDLQADEFAEG